MSDTQLWLTPTTWPGMVSGVRYVEVDLFPAITRFSFTSQVAERSRVIVTTEPKVYVFVDAVGGPAVIYEAEYSVREGNHRNGTLTTDDGTVTFEHQKGCGCGSRLKGFRPFSQLVHVG